LGDLAVELGSRADVGFEEKAEKFIIEHVETLAAAYGEKR